MVTVSLVEVLPPSFDRTMAPAVVMLDAVDLASDPGRLGAIAREMLARAAGEVA